MLRKDLNLVTDEKKSLHFVCLKSETSLPFILCEVVLSS